MAINQHIEAALLPMLGAERRQRAAELLKRHGFTGNIQSCETDLEQLEHALRFLTPWTGNTPRENYQDIAYLHGSAFRLLSRHITDPVAIGGIAEALPDSLEDWCLLADRLERLPILKALFVSNAMLLSLYRVASRAFTSVMLLLLPDDEMLEWGLMSWPAGRFGLIDIKTTCYQARLLGVSPVYCLCGDSDVYNLDDYQRPSWCDRIDGFAIFANVLVLTKEQIDAYLTEHDRSRLESAIESVSPIRAFDEPHPRASQPGVRDDQP